VTRKRIASCNANGWEDRARCKGLPTEWFYPPQGRTPLDLTKIEIICTLCSTCPVKKECLKASLENIEEYGLWGGMTRVARDKLTKKAWVCYWGEPDENGQRISYIELEAIPVEQEIIEQAQSDSLYLRRKSYKKNIITHQWLYKLDPAYKQAREIIDEHFLYETPTTPIIDAEKTIDPPDTQAI
jgi:hypothetical protein